jgi:hypothetical protein
MPRHPTALYHGQFVPKIIRKPGMNLIAFIHVAAAPRGWKRLTVKIITGFAGIIPHFTWFLFPPGPPSLLLDNRKPPEYRSLRRLFKHPPKNK